MLDASQACQGWRRPPSSIPALASSSTQTTIGVVRPAPGGRAPWRGRAAASAQKMPGVSTRDDLRVVLDHDAADQRARGLHLARDDRDLGADQRVDECGLADIGRADQRDEAAARRGSAA